MIVARPVISWRNRCLVVDGVAHSSGSGQTTSTVSRAFVYARISSAQLADRNIVAFWYGDDVVSVFFNNNLGKTETSFDELNTWQPEDLVAACAFYDQLLERMENPPP